jgi:bacillolysin
VLVDAEEHNSVALNFSEIAHAKARFVCDRTNVPGASAHCLSPTDGYARTEDQAATGVSEVDAAYDYMGDTYDFYKNRLGRDSIDGAGMDLRATVRWCPNSTECPYRNAFWNEAQAIFGDGYAATDDIVAHELTHGVTDYESNLKYYYQSGAINESFSDIFGEFVDLTNGKGTDTAATRWIHGEDTPQSSQRNMKDHPATPGSPRPDRMTSPYYVATAHLEDANGVDPDAGGIHYNSGVGNKAAYLITDGATFNGYTVTGLGINKAAKIYYEVQTNLLTSGSDYQDLYAALPQACTNLIGTANITSANCQEVKDAVNATEMNLQPTTAPAPEAPVCDAGQQNMDLFFDDMENTASGNWQTQTLVGTQPWFFGAGQNSYATSGVTNLIGIDVATRSDFTALMAQSVQVPTGKTTYLHFKHAHGFEDNNAGTYYDGGVVEYSTGGGSTWEDLASKFTHNGPAGTISASRDNPLGGRQGFIGDSNGYISSRANLSSLAGQGVRLRWRIGTDSTFRDDSWWIDDVRIYTCGAADTIPPKVMNTSPATIAPTANVTAIFSEAMDASPTEADGDPSTISGTTFKLVKLKSDGTTTRVTAAVSYSPATTKAILNPSSNLSLGRLTRPR